MLQILTSLFSMGNNCLNRIRKSLWFREHKYGPNSEVLEIIALIKHIDCIGSGVRHTLCLRSKFHYAPAITIQSTKGQTSALDRTLPSHFLTPAVRALHPIGGIKYNFYRNGLHCLFCFKFIDILQIRKPMEVEQWISVVEIVINGEGHRRLPDGGGRSG